MSTFTVPSILRAWPWLGALLALWIAATGAFAQEADPPGRVATVSQRQGGVVFAPQGEEEWVELPANRPLSRGDRIWSDQGARAELQLGSATVHLDGESQLGLAELDERAAQLMLQQGTVNAHVRELLQGENFEIGTPNLAFRALQPGDYRIDVDPRTQQTRVVVHSGLAALFGETGQSVQLGAGQQANFAGRQLAQVQGPAWRQGGFDRWAAERNRLEEHSLTARYVPRGVVGYAQLDAHGSWVHEPGLGAVWYPRVAVADWAPYRYGHWDWIAPWGWTWIDDAPWGFAPFHYGRWTMIGERWAWVPGRMVARPVYSPALVVFVGGPQFSFSLSSGPAVGWYPLAPGEAWWPAYRTSPRYVNFANYNINLNAYPRHYANHVWRHRPHAVTAGGEDDFRRGRPVYRHWQPVQPHAIDRAQVGVVPGRPDHRAWRDQQPRPSRLHAAPPAAVQPAMPPRTWGGGELPPAVREQYRAQREQERLRRDAEREQYRLQEQLHDQQRYRRDLEREARERAQRDGWQRQQQDRGHREAWQRQQQDQGQREAWQRQREQERAQRDADRGREQDRAAREQQRVQRQQPEGLGSIRYRLEQQVREQQRQQQQQQAPAAQPNEPQRGRDGGGRGQGRGRD